jgi:hypothetical protein
MSQLEVRWNEKHIVPVVTGKDCEWASWLWSQYGRKNTFLFWDSVRDLMLAGFCLLMLVGCGSSQAEIVSPEVQARASELSALLTSSKTVETKSDEILKAVESNTTALAAIKGQIDSLEASVVSSKPILSKSLRRGILLALHRTERSCGGTLKAIGIRRFWKHQHICDRITASTQTA